jgi:hypothetical protein
MLTRQTRIRARTPTPYVVARPRVMMILPDRTSSTIW